MWLWLFPGNDLGEHFAGTSMLVSVVCYALSSLLCGLQTTL